MVLTNGKILQDREHAAHLLAIKVLDYKDSNAIVLGVGSGGCSVGLILAKELNLPFEAVFCREVKHPANPRKTIGSVSDGLVLMNEDMHDIPQDFIMRQITQLQYEIEKDYKFIYGNHLRPTFRYKTVIPVIDVLDTADSLLAVIKVIKLHQPMQVIVAVPVVAPQAAAEIANEVSGLLFVHMESGGLEGKDLYDYYPTVDLREIKNSITSVRRYGT